MKIKHLIIHRFFLVALNSQYIAFSNSILYLAVVYVCTIITAVVLNQIDRIIVKAIQGKKALGCTA